MKSFISNSIYPLFLFAAFCVVLPPLFKSLSLVLLLLVVLVNFLCNRNKECFNFNLSLKNPLLWLLVFYLLHCIGMFYTSDVNEGLKDLSIKLPLLLFPLAFFFIPKRLLTREKLWNVFSSFALGLLIMQIFSLGNGLVNAFAGEEFNIKEILYTRLGKKTHTTYFSLYTCFAFMMFYFMPFKKHFALRLIAMSWLAIFNVLLSSRIGILAMAFICVVILCNELFIKKQYVNVLRYLIVCAVFATSFFVVKEFNNRYANIVAKTQIETKKQTKIVDSVSQRSFIYSNVAEILKKSPVIGVGTGDVKGELEDFYSQKGVDFGRYLNAHNQFVQTAIALGTIGLICFLISLFMLSYNFWTKESLILLLSIAILCVFMMTESILERQQGVHFFAFYFVWLSVFAKIGGNKTKN